MSESPFCFQKISTHWGSISEDRHLEIFATFYNYLAQTDAHGLLELISGWGDSRVSKVFAVQVWGPEFNPQTQIKSQMLWYTLVMLAKGQWRQEDPWSLLVSHPSQINELQVLFETLPQRYKLDSSWGMTPGVDYWPLHAYTHACILMHVYTHACTHAYIHEHDSHPHTQKLHIPC